MVGTLTGYENKRELSLEAPRNDELPARGAPGWKRKGKGRGGKRRKERRDGRSEREGEKAELSLLEIERPFTFAGSHMNKGAPPRAGKTAVRPAAGALNGGVVTRFGEAGGG